MILLLTLVDLSPLALYKHLAMSGMPPVTYITKPYARRLRQELRIGCTSSGRPLSGAVRRSHIEKLRRCIPVRSRQSRDAELAEVDELERMSTPSATTSDDLYIMRYVGILPNVLKIGRSANPETRRRTLETSHDFRVEIVAVFPQKGHLEPEVHRLLAHRRSGRGAGTEWFRIDAQSAMDTIMEVIENDTHGMSMDPNSADDAVQVVTVDGAAQE